MRKTNKKLMRLLALVLTLTMLAGIVPVGVQAAARGRAVTTLASAGAAEQLTDEQRLEFFQENMDPDKVSDAELPAADEEVRVIVELETQSLLQLRQQEDMQDMSMSGFLKTSEAREQLAAIRCAQEAVLQQMQSAGMAGEVTYSYSTVSSGFAARIAYGDLAEVAAMDGVRDVTLCQIYYPDVMGQASLGEALTAAEVAAYANDTAYQGEGMVIGILDTGLDWTHEAFANAPQVQRLTRDSMRAMAKYDITYDADGNVDSVAAYSYAALWYAQANSGSELALLTADDLYKSAKVPFGFDYADGDADVVPSASAVENYGNDHGTHVAGIAAGKTVDDEGNVTLAGQAPEAQLAIFKVFSDKSSGASTDTLLAALNDAILLDVDVINMSLGSPGGFSAEAEGSTVQTYYDAVKAYGILLNCSAGNTYSSAMGSAQSDYPNTSDPDSGIVSSPSSYDASLSVASVNASETKTFAVGGQFVPYNDVSGHDFAAELMGEAAEVSYEYVMVPGFGAAEDYAGLDVAGKIAVVMRGSLSFNDKQLNAAAAGAAGCLIYNNRDGYLLNMAVDNHTIPTASISYLNGLMMAQTESKTVTLANAGGMVAMSDFSSWGPLADLELKPEITAPGGDIYSSLPFGQYGYMSGTSMASPYLAGTSAAAMQYVTKMYPAMGDDDKRALVNQLLMSTADILYDDRGVAYSPRRQGSGMVDLSAAVSTPAYLYVKGSDKTKISLGDDPHKLGVYDVAFQVKNLTAFPVSYEIGALVQTETASADGSCILQMGRELSADTHFSVTGGTLDGDTLTIPANGEAGVVATITLTDESRAYMDEWFENGIYVEGFVELRNADDPSLSIPYMGFYGDWTQAPMFEEADYYNGEAVKRYATVPTGVYAMMYVFPLGSYPFAVPEGYEEPAASRDLIALNLGSGNGISNLYYLRAGLLRSAKTTEMVISDADTGETITSATVGNTPKAYYSSSTGTIRPGYVGAVWPELMSYSTTVPSGTRMHYSVTTWLDDEGVQRNERSSYSFDLTADSEYPYVVNRNDLKFYYGEDGRVYLDVVLADNFALAGATLYSATKGYDSYGRPTGGTMAGSNYYTGIQPIVKEDGSVYRNYEEASVTFDVTDFYKELYEGVFYILAYDYALNECCLKVSLDEIPVTSITLDTTEATLPIRGYVQLNASVAPDNATNQGVTWSSSDTAVAEVRNGLVKAVGTGTATITVRASAYSDVYSSCGITVTGEMGPEVPMEVLNLNRTAFSLDVGATDTNTRLSTYSPYTATNFELVWSSSDETVATVDENGAVTGVSAGTCVITARAKLGDAYDTVNVTVKAVEYGTGSFAIDGDVLVGYSGAEETVTVPAGIRIIGDNAFKGNTTIKHVVLPDSVEEIRYRAFYGCSNLESINLSETMTALGEQTFYNCKKLATLGLDDGGVIPKGLVEIPKGCFYNCNVLAGDLVIPEGVTTICQEAFYSCKALTSITMADTVVSMGPEGAYAQFSGCSSVTSVELSAGLTALPRNCFFSCTSLTQLPDLKNITELGNACFQHLDSAVSVTVPAQITSLGNLCFAYADNLESIHFEGSPALGTGVCSNNPKLTAVTGNLTQIGTTMFEKCTALVNFVMPDYVSAIGTNAFRNCTALETVTFPATYAAEGLTLGVTPFNGCKAFTGMVVEEGCTVLKYEDGILLSGDGKKLIAMPSGFAEASYTVAEGVETIGANAFYASKTLTSITFPESLKAIEEYAFYNCAKLTAVDLPNGVQTVGTYAFYGCSAVTDLDLGLSLEAVEAHAFQGMTEVTAIVLPDTVRYVGDYGFEECNAAAIITIPEGVTSIGVYAFENCKKAESIILPSTLTELGVRAFYNCNAATVINTGSASAIPDYAFYGCKLAEQIVLGDWVTSIGSYAFNNCLAVENIPWPSQLESVGKQAFYMCRMLRDLDLSGTKLSFIGASAFYQPYELQTLVFPDTLETIESKAFAYLNYNKAAYVDTVHLPASVTSVASDAFYYANRLRAITVDESNPVYTAANGILILKETGELYLWPMANTTTEFAVPENMTTIPSKMFQNNSSLKKVTIHSGVSYIGTYAFANSNIEEFAFEPSANGLVIDYGAFSNCDDLTELSFPYGTTELGGSVVNGCEALTSLYLPDTITAMGANTFAYCTSLKDVHLSAGLSAMPNSAFANCSSLEEITLPAAMSDCGITRLTSPFAHCPSFKNIWVEEGSRYYKSVDGVLYDANGTTLRIYPMGRTEERYTIPEGVVRVGARAFLNTAALKRVCLPSTLVRVGDMAFYMCGNLKDFYFNGMTAPVLETNLSSYGGYMNYASYWNFVDRWMSVDDDTGKVIPNELGLNLYYPDGATGFDSYVWETYFYSGSTNVMDTSYFTVTGLTVTESEGRTAQLTWDPVKKSGAEAIAYKVERAGATHIVTDSQDTWIYGTFETLTDDLGRTEYRDETCLDFGMGYVYRVSAYNAKGETGPAAVATIVIAADETNPDEMAALVVIQAIEALKPVENLSLADETRVQEVQAMYDALTEAQKALVPNLDTLEEAFGWINGLYALAVEELIAALPATDRIGSADAEAIAAAREAYDALTEAQKALITNLDVLLACESALADAVTVENVEAMIAALPTAAEVAADNAGAIAAARAAYDALSGELKVQVDEVYLEKLEACETALASALAVQSVNDLIAALPVPAEVAAADAEAIAAARAAYDALTEEQKLKVTDLAKLTACETALADLLAAQAVEAVIAALPRNVTLDDGAAVAAAREAYDALTEAQKALVSNLDVLEAAEAALNGKRAVQAVEDLIDALPEPVTVDDAEAIAAARESYDALTPEQQAQVRNYAGLLAAEAALAAWENLPFTDVFEEEWYYDAVKYVWQHGLIRGVTGSEFAPDIQTTRGMLVTVLYRMAGTPETGDAQSFTDVSDNAYYAKAVAWAAGMGIALGYEDGTFRPDQTVSRAQMVTFLSRYAEKIDGAEIVCDEAAMEKYQDWATVPRYARTAMGWAVASGVIQGVSVEPAALAPNATASRAQFAQILYNYRTNG